MPVGSFGIPEPLEYLEEQLASMGLIFTPAILVSLGGFRLGQGGFYDRLSGQPDLGAAPSFCRSFDGGASCPRGATRFIF